MNRRSILTLLVGVMVIPCELASAVMAKESPKSSCEDCKKCDPTCKCNCKKKCRCKPGCCKKGHTDSGSSGRPPHSRPPQGRPPQGRPSPDRHSRYKEMIKKFDKDKDGKLDGKEREALKKYIQKRRG
jgi:hypothetical protein